MEGILLKADALNVTVPKEGTGRTILQEIGFDLKRGETLGIVGPSGSGKTMLARALIGMLPDGVGMTAGEIRFFSEDGKEHMLNTLGHEELNRFRRQHVAMIYQNPGLSLNPSMRIGKQIRIISGLGGKVASPQICNEVLSDMGFGDPRRILAAYPHQLSGGELQRAIIGMTILKAPRLWIADEPTTALDAETRVEIVRLLQRVRTKLGASMIYISHDVGTVRQLADRVLFMRGGGVEQIVDAGILPDHPVSLAFLERNRHGENIEGPVRSHTRAETVLEVKDVSKAFGQGFSFGAGRKYRVPALRNVSFRLVKGESLAVIGPSGSGKSTLGRILTGIVKADAGSIRFRERELIGITAKEWKDIRRNVQLIHQNPAQSLTPHLTVEQHLIEALELSGRVAIREAINREIGVLLDELGLSRSLTARYPFQISGGEAQRVAIARALALRPSVVICDEITSALDRENQQQLIELMGRLREEFAFSLIWITHDLNVVRQVADRLILLDKGTVIEEGPTEDFFTHPASEKGKKMLDAYRMFT